MSNCRLLKRKDCTEYSEKHTPNEYIFLADYIDSHNKHETHTHTHIDTRFEIRLLFNGKRNIHIIVTNWFGISFLINFLIKC